MQKITLIGLGIMGTGIAHNLLEAGFDLTVYNRTRAKAEPLAEYGAHIADSIGESVAQAEVIITIVSDDNASRAVWLSDEGILAHVPTNAICIESSTLSLEWLHELAQRVTAQGLEFLDSPVGGSKEAAQAGKLALLVGGEATTIEKVRPIFEAFGASINHMGAVGSGLAMKLVINHLVGLEMLMLAEGLALAEKLGVDTERYLAIVGNGPLGSPFMRAKIDMLKDGSYTDPHFMLQWIRKDFSNILRAADAVHAPMPLAGTAHEVYQMAQAHGLGEYDFAGIIEQLRGN